MFLKDKERYLLYVHFCRCSDVEAWQIVLIKICSYHFKHTDIVGIAISDLFLHRTQFRVKTYQNTKINFNILVFQEIIYNMRKSLINWEELHFYCMSSEHYSSPQSFIPCVTVERQTYFKESSSKLIDLERIVAIIVD